MGDPLDLSSFYISRGEPCSETKSYARMANRSWEALEAALERLEEAPALVFASGMAATMNLMLALSERVPAGTRPRFVLPTDGYHGVRTLAEMLRGRGIEHELVDHADLNALERALTQAPHGACIVWTETPTNPVLRVFDLQALAKLCRAHRAPLVCDNTTATAALSRPLDWGVTATLTSLSKASAGHSDIVLGAVATRATALFDRLHAWRTHGGAIAGPFEAWLALRGLKTLPVRIERQSQTALAIAHSFEVTGPASAERTDEIVARSQLIRQGTSFGGVESSWERRGRWPAESAPPNLIRLSIGLESTGTLQADLNHSLKTDCDPVRDPGGRDPA